MSKVVYLIILFFLFASTTFSQQNTFSKEIRFSNFLQAKEQYAEAFFVLNNIDSTNLNDVQKDSLNYEKGWLYYSKKKLDSAVLFFAKVSANDPRKMKITFFEAYCLGFLKKLDSSEVCYKNIVSNDSTIVQLKNFQLSGISLLRKDFKSFDKYAANFTYTNYAFSNEEKIFTEAYKEASKHKKKSPFLAATLSAIIPGLGKIYAGKKKEGIGAFIPIVSSGIIALEAYNKGGFKDARFLIFGTLFSTFYIGNIWGSSLAVKISESEYNTKYENKILFNLHIPLRNIFN